MDAYVWVHTQMGSVVLLGFFFYCFGNIMKKMVRYSSTGVLFHQISTKITASQLATFQPT